MFSASVQIWENSEISQVHLSGKWPNRQRQRLGDIDSRRLAAGFGACGLEIEGEGSTPVYTYLRVTCYT